MKFTTYKTPQNWKCYNTRQNFSKLDRRLWFQRLKILFERTVKMNSDKQESIGYSFFYSCHDGQNNKSETPPEVLTLGWTHSTWGRRHRDQPYLGAKWRQKAEIKWKPQRPFLWTSRWTEKKIRWRKTLFNNIRYFDITKSAFGNNRLFCARIWSRLASELKTKSPCHIK